MSDDRLKRLKIRAWRRGTKEMDLILGGFFDAQGDKLSPAELDALEALMEENDQELYQWISGQAAMPEAHAEILSVIARHAGALED